MSAEEEAKKIADMVGGKLGPVMDYGNGEGGCVVSFPLPKDHWIYRGEHDPATLGPMELGNEAMSALRTRLEIVARRVIRGCTFHGKDMDFDPDAMVKEFIYYFINGTEDR